MLLDDKIFMVRNKLNKSIADREDYDVIYKISVELDELIAQYYAEKAKENKKNLHRKEKNQQKRQTIWKRQIHLRFRKKHLYLPNGSNIRKPKKLQKQLPNRILDK